MDREREHIIADKTMLQVARATSMVFTPFSIPFLSFLVLFLFSYLRIMPIQYKLIVLGIVYCFTILTPTITIFLFRKINGFARQELSERKKRYVPILLTIISYVFTQFPFQIHCNADNRYYQRNEDDPCHIPRYIQPAHHNRQNTYEMIVSRIGT